MAKTFLKAEWRKLSMFNYAIDPAVLLPYLPAGTEIDFHENTCYVSLVGFMFLNTRLRGIRVPFHSNFEEINLRFYVTRTVNNEVKRGVVFIKEIVPKPALSFVANTVYGENYETLKMAHSWVEMDNTLKVNYAVKKGKWFNFGITASTTNLEALAGTEAEFITEHYWGYTKSGGAKTGEYGVEHPQWDVYKTIDYSVSMDFEILYGKDFAFLNGLQPKSVFLAEGSEILVKAGSHFS